MRETLLSTVGVCLDARKAEIKQPVNMFGTRTNGQDQFPLAGDPVICDDF